MDCSTSTVFHSLVDQPSSSLVIGSRATEEGQYPIASAASTPLDENGPYVPRDPMATDARFNPITHEVVRQPRPQLEPDDGFSVLQTWRRLPASQRWKLAPPSPAHAPHQRRVCSSTGNFVEEEEEQPPCLQTARQWRRLR